MALEINQLQLIKNLEEIKMKIINQIIKKEFLKIYFIQSNKFFRLNLVEIKFFILFYFYLLLKISNINFLFDIVLFIN